MPDTSAESYYLAGKDAAAKEREERLLAAKRKLKSYRARQAKTGSTTSNDSLASRSTATNRRESIQSAASLIAASLDPPSSPHHKHRRSISKSALLGERVTSLPAVSSPLGGAHGRRASRHSRGPSLSAQIKGNHSHQRSRSRASISSNTTPLLNAPQDGFASGSDLFSTALSPFARSTSPLPSGAKTPTQHATPSVGWITNPFLPPPSQLSQPEASTSKLTKSQLPTSPTRTYVSKAPRYLPPPPKPSTVAASSPAPSATPAPASTASTAAMNKSLTHERRASRHARQSSVSNFRESLEIVSGQGQFSASSHQLGYAPVVSSFAATPSSVSLSPSNSFQGVAIPMIPINSASSSPRPSLSATTAMPWEADPAKVLEALKERGRRESDSLDPELDRRNALEALEGRVAAPSAMIDLGNEAEGELMTVPKSPGFTDAGKPQASGALSLPSVGTSAAPHSPLPGFVHSPMIGLGMTGKRKDSWSAPGPVTAAGAKGAMDLGMLIEEEEEEDHADPLISPRRRTPRKSRPASIITNGSVKSSPSDPSSPGPRSRTSTVESMIIPVTETVEDDDGDRPIAPPPRRDSTTFTPRPLRTLSLSGSIMSSGSPGGTPSTSAGSPPTTKKTPLQASTLTSPTNLPAPIEDARTSPTLDKKMSLFHSAAVATANGHDMTPSPGAGNGPRSQTGGGLRSLSIGSNTSPPLDRMPNRSPLSSQQRRVFSTGSVQGSPSPTSAFGPSTSPTAEGFRRSSITYKTASIPAVATPDGSLANAAAQANRKQSWRISNGGGGAALAGYPFPSYGGFGDLHIDTPDDEDGSHSVTATSPSSSTSALPNGMKFGNGMRPESAGSSLSRSVPPSSTRDSSLDQDRDASPLLRQQLTSLQTQVEHLKAAQMQLTSTHALEMADMEKSADEEALGFRTRIEELEKALEEASTARRFEVEGLTREIEQARDALKDVTEERDELREDVEGWRQRCSTLEAGAKKDREDDALAKAQAKLIGEMRDQMYNLVASLDQERSLHAETRKELERLGGSKALAFTPPSSKTTSILNKSKPTDMRIDALAMPPAHTILEPTPVTPGVEDGRFTRGQHVFQAASDGSVLSNSSFGQSHSGNTTEGTSVDDSYSIKMTTSPPSHAAGFGSKGRESEFGSTPALNQLQTLNEEEEEEEAEHARAEADRLRHDSGSTGSVSSVAMPLTPSKEDPSTHHQRSHSFVRHWSFPKGSVSSIRVSSDDDHSFFDYNRHTSLPPLPLDAQFPPFVTADLTVEDDDLALHDVNSPQLTRSAPAHGRRPSSPRPQDRMQPHVRQFSGQYAARAPPVSPSAHARAQLSTSVTSTRSEPFATPVKAGRFSGIGSIIGSLGGWSPSNPSPASSLPSSVPSKPTMSRTNDESDEFSPSRRRTSSSASRGYAPVPPPPMSSKYSAGKKGLPSQRAQRYIKASEVKRPRASQLAVLNFQPACCAEDEIYYV